MDKITIAILCKQKAHCLPLYLDCIDNQTYPKNLISIYIRSNNNTDNTLEILQAWANKHREEYDEIYGKKMY
jgi:glycosyltransferase involved in cell wall biosynthesis